LSYIARLINLIAEKRQNQCPYLTNTWSVTFLPWYMHFNKKNGGVKLVYLLFIYRWNISARTVPYCNWMYTICLLGGVDSEETNTDNPYLTNTWSVTFLPWYMHFNKKNGGVKLV
jgi:hypothetical protein